MRNNIPTSMPCTGAENRFPKKVAVRADAPANQQMTPATAALARALADKPRLQMAATSPATGTIASARSAIDVNKLATEQPASRALFV